MDNKKSSFTSFNPIESSSNANLLRKECFASIPLRRNYEILLLISFLIVFVFTSVYLWKNILVFDFWFYILLGIILFIVILGYLMDRKYRPKWNEYLLAILKEMNGVDTVELSEFINKAQPFLGANLGNCEKFLKIARKFMEEQVIEIVIRGPKIYLKGYEPPEEPKEEKADEKNDEQKK